MRNLMRTLSILLTAAILLTCGPMVNAKPLTDYDDYEAIALAAHSSSNGYAMLEAVQLLADLNAVGGDGKSLRLEDSFTRAQFAAMIFKFATGKADMTETEKEIYGSVKLFSDLDDLPWAVPFINWVAMRGYVSGVGDGKFGPNRVISQSEAVVLLGRVLGFDNEKSNVPKQMPGESYADYLTHVSLFVEAQFGIIRGSYAMSSSGITRGEAFVFFANALNAPTVTYDESGNIRQGKSFGETSYGLQTLKGIITGTYYAGINTLGAIPANPYEAQLTLSEAKIAGSNFYYVGEAVLVTLPPDVTTVMDTYDYLGREITVTAKLTSSGEKRIMTQYGAVTKTVNNYETTPVYSAAEEMLGWKNALGNDASITTGGAGFGENTRGAVSVVQNGAVVSDGGAISASARFRYVSRADSEDGIIIAFVPTIVKVTGAISTDSDRRWPLRTLNDSDNLGPEFVLPVGKSVSIASSSFVVGGELLDKDAVVAVLPVGNGRFVAYKTEHVEKVRATGILSAKSITIDGATYAASELTGSRGRSLSASDTGSVFEIRLFDGKVVDFRVLSYPAGVGVVYASVQNGADSVVSLFKKDGSTLTARLNQAGTAAERGKRGTVWTPAEDTGGSPLQGEVPSGSGTAYVTLPLNTAQDAVLVYYTESEDGSSVTIDLAAGETTTYDYDPDGKPDYIRIAAYDNGADRFLTAPDMIPVFEAEGTGLTGGVSVFSADSTLGAASKNETAYVLRNRQDDIIGALTAKRTAPVVSSAKGLYYVTEDAGEVIVDGAGFVITQRLYDIAAGAETVVTYMFSTAAEADAAVLPAKGGYVKFTGAAATGDRKANPTYISVKLSDFFSFTVANLSQENFYDTNARKFALSDTVISVAVKAGSGAVTGYCQGTVEDIKNRATVYLAINTADKREDGFGIPAVLVVNP